MQQQDTLVNVYLGRHTSRRCQTKYQLELTITFV